MSIKILALETSANACSAALLIDKEVRERYTLAPRQHAQLILPMVQSLLVEAEFKLSQLDAIAFGCGPGSFTGVRIAAGVAQGLAFGADLTVISVSSLHALAQGAYESFHAEKVLTGFDARMHEIYWGIYRLGENGLMQPVKPDMLSFPQNVFQPEEGDWLGAGDAWRIYKEILLNRLDGKVIKCQADYFPHAKYVAILGHRDFLAGNILSAEQAIPVYLRSKIAWHTNI